MPSRENFGQAGESRHAEFVALGIGHDHMVTLESFQF